MSNAQQKATRLEELYQYHHDNPELLINGGSSNIIFGRGNPDARIVLIGEAPGQQEDRLGLPFVGRSGQLLNTILQALELPTDELYITNAVKVRPPNNRTPSPTEISRSRPILLEQLKIIDPDVICTLGATAWQAMSNRIDPITRIRGTMQQLHGCMVMPTYHPAYILRNSKELKTLYQDLERAYFYAQGKFKQN